MCKKNIWVTINYKKNDLFYDYGLHVQRFLLIENLQCPLLLPSSAFFLLSLSVTPVTHIAKTWLNLTEHIWDFTLG